MQPRNSYSGQYLIALSQAQQHEVMVRADLLMEFAYASKELCGWLEQNGGAPEEALQRWHTANHALCRGLAID